LPFSVIIIINIALYAFPCGKRKHLKGEEFFVFFGVFVSDVVLVDLKSDINYFKKYIKNVGRNFVIKNNFFV